MMKQTVNEFNRAKSKVAGDIKSVITDTEDLLKAAAEVSGDGFAIARGKCEEKLGSAKARLADASQAAVEQTRDTATAANRFVHDNPWPVIGVAAVAGLLIGFLAARR